MIEILKEHPKAAEVMKEYYIDLMIESAQDLPAHFREFLQDKGLEMSNIADMMEAAPRNLFDVFDKYEIIISITYDRHANKFCYFVNEYQDKTHFDTRKEADKDAVATALTLLEAKLNTLENDNEES
jgi:crotonobetainyl-CoA:carnitine CoA-transferase CaiB-like acyl-CoA transferase